MGDIVARELRLDVLQALSGRGDMTPGEVADWLGADKRSKVYMALDRMEADGLVASRREEQATQRGNRRRFYKITGLGERARKLGEIAEQLEAGVRSIRVPGGIV